MSILARPSGDGSAPSAINVCRPSKSRKRQPEGSNHAPFTRSPINGTKAGGWPSSVFHVTWSTSLARLIGFGFLIFIQDHYDFRTHGQLHAAGRPDAQPGPVPVHHR